MKRERKPPKTWRRNMLAGVGLLAVLDGTILSSTPNLARLVLATVVTVLVGGFILAVWRSNSRMEKAAADAEKNARGGGKSPGGGRPMTKESA